MDAPAPPALFVPVATPQIGLDEVAAVQEVLLSGQYVSGKRVEAFEREFAAWTGTADAVAVNSGTAALHAALFAAGIGPGDEVIVPPLTFFSTVTSVIQAGGVPVFADISLDNFCLDPADVARRITPRTKAILPVHFYGHAADMEALNDLAATHGLTVVEDVAQAHGTEYKGRKADSLGRFGCFSFYATKHMTTGEGGIVTTDDRDAAARMRLFRSHGMQGRDDHVLLGWNYRMTELAAAIGSVQLRKLDGLNAARIAVSERLMAALADLPWLELPKVPAHVRHTYFWLHGRVDEARLGMSQAELVKRLRSAGVEVRNRYREPLYRQPILTTAIPPLLRLSAGDNLPDYGALHLPNVEAIAGRMIGLPNRPDMTDTEVAHVVAVLRGMAS